MATTLKGSIKETYLPDIIQIVSQNGNPGIFTFENGTSKVQLYVGQGGHLVHALSTNRATGLDAMEELAVWNDGTYAFDEGPLPQFQPNINKPTSKVINGLSSRIDEWKVLGRVIPNVNLFPYPSVLPGEKQDFNSREARLMEFANGYYTVEELAMAMGESITAIAKTMYGLMNKQVLVLKAVRYATPPHVAPKSAPPKAQVPEVPQTIPQAFHAPTADMDPFAGADPFARPSDQPDTHAQEALQAAAQTAAAAPAVATDGRSVTDYLMFAKRIKEMAIQVLPASLHPDVEDLFTRCKGTILAGGGADIQTLKNLAIAISKAVKAKAEAGACDPSVLNTFNLEAKKFFGKS